MVRLLLALFLACCPAAPALAGAVSVPVPIGVAVAATSNAALFGQEQMLGARIAAEAINAAGGVGGTNIALVFQDTAGDEAGAKAAFTTLIERDKAVAIIGPTLSQQAFAADPLADRAGVPVVAPSNTAAGIPEIGPFVCRVSAPMSQVAPHAIRQARASRPGMARAAVLYAENDAYSASETRTFQDALKKEGLAVAAVQTFRTTDTDFSRQAAAVIEAKADLAVISGLAVDAGTLVGQLRQAGYTGLIVGGNGFNSPSVFPVCGAWCDGVLVAQAYSPAAVETNPANKAFVAAYEAAHGKAPGQFSAQAGAAVQVVAQALARVERESGKKIADFDLAGLRAALNAALRAGVFQTPLGEIAIAPSGEVAQKDLYVARIAMQPDGVTGSFVLVAP
jgi:branched-chain amino acid transport system substrate-binding protein